MRAVFPIGAFACVLVRVCAAFACRLWVHAGACVCACDVLVRMPGGRAV